ncbi:MAG: hypothetical protein GXP24_04975 [Planctomycetes bacterium]|nr:hypothetical protein [Planctomycetota bacterium]
MDRWDIMIIAGAGYVAVTSLVRLMAARRNHLVDQVRQQIEQQRGQQAAKKPADEDADLGAA